MTIRWWTIGLLVSVLLAGCARPTTPTLHVLNWSDYIDPGLIPEFEKRAGCKVVYDNFAAESELEAKLALSNGGGYDVVVPSDRSLAPLIKKNLLRELDHAKLPNLQHIDRQFLNPPYDPGNRHGVPYFWGTVAVGVRKDKIQEPVRGFEVLFDPRYQGKITMLDDPENVVAIALLYLGLPMNSTKDEDLAKAKDLLLKQKPNVQAYTSDNFKERLLKGEAWAVLGWSGDLLQAARESEGQIQVVVPAQGTMIWSDSLSIPRGAKNLGLAYEFINFLLDPDIAARNANAVKFPTPNAAARAQLTKELLGDPAIYPPADVMKKCEWLKDRGKEIVKIEKLWKDLRQ